MAEEKGGFLFISHSHKDMDQVRQLRNKLEEAGYEPLCFYLKALDDSEDELDDLIKREIDAREWFVYAVSENSRASEWVQKECDWRTRKESTNKQIFKWDLQSDIPIDEISKVLIRGLRVHIIYDHKDIDFVNKLKIKLKEKDLQVSTDFDIISGKSSIEQEAEMIKEASEYGTNIVVLSKNSMDSTSVMEEVSIAKHCRSLIFPIYIDDVKLEGFFIMHLAGIPSMCAPEYIKDENDMNFFIEKVVDEIKFSLNEHFK